MRQRFYWDQEANDRGEPGWQPKRPVAARRCHIISDVMDGIRSMADGKWYDSKSRYRKEIRARGYIEVGNERLPRREFSPPSAVEDIERAWRE